MTGYDPEPDYWEDVDDFPEDDAEDAYIAEHQAAYEAMPWWRRAAFRMSRPFYRIRSHFRNRHYRARMRAACERGAHDGCPKDDPDGCWYLTAPF